jgi:hypothetical protein
MAVLVPAVYGRHYFDKEWPQLLEVPLTVLEAWKPHCRVDVIWQCWCPLCMVGQALL